MSVSPWKPQTIEEVVREHIIKTLRHFEGNRTHAAAALDISVRNLRMRIDAYEGMGFVVERSKWDTTRVVTLKCDHCGEEFPTTVATYKAKAARGQTVFFCGKPHTQAYWKERGQKNETDDSASTNV